MAKVNIQPVAYRGSTAVLPDLLAGRLTMSFSNVVNAAPLVREGKLRAFAVSLAQALGARRPICRPWRSSGFPDFEAVPWFGLLAPAGTPQAIIDKVHRETVKVLALPDVRKRFEDAGLDVIGGTPAEFAEVIRTEIPYWAKIIKEAGIKAKRVDGRRRACDERRFASLLIALVAARGGPRRARRPIRTARSASSSASRRAARPTSRRACSRRSSAKPGACR